MKDDYLKAALRKCINEELVKFNEGQDIEDNCADMLLISKDGKILLLKRPKSDNLFPGKWCIPGGHRQDDETIKQSAERECKEESGIEVKSSKRLFPWTYPDGFKTVFHYAREGEDYDPQEVKLSKEHVDFKWSSPKTVLDSKIASDLAGDIREPLEKAFKELDLI